MSNKKNNQTTNMLKRGVVTLVNADSGKRSTAQVTSMGTTSTIETIYPYGIYAVAPQGSDVAIFNVLGGEENKVGIPYDVAIRFKNLKAGEVIVGNPVTQSYTKFSSDGSVEVISDKDFIMTVKGKITINVEGDASITSQGNVDLIASGDVNLGGTGGAGVARIGDAVTGGVITGGSTKVFAV